MERAYLETLFLCGVALLMLLEIYYLLNFEADRKILNEQKKKRLFLLLMILGIQVIPFFYCFSIDFGPTDYHFWKWLSFPVAICYIFFVWLFGKALFDLGRWWLPGQELKEDLELVRSGTFHYIRHPMYTALLGISVCQVFMIQNWIAGPVSIFLVTPFCFYQIRREEYLLTKFFGDDYRLYMSKTGMLWPKEEKIPILAKIFRQMMHFLIKVVKFLWHKARLYVGSKPSA